ncbi:hypothetical protein BD779DRAFT_1498364 [Infundibulicybe gibba]|nr:hypothetical protein BD779DRAFT_1498364 [Infundibulicybe gibba]
MAEKFIYAQWPPKLSQAQIEHLTLEATTYALSHGLLYLPPGSSANAPSSAIHAPLSLFPSPFPRRLFDQSRDLQTAYNVLYARIAMDEEFLDRVMGTVDGVGAVDDFVGQLWTGWKQIRDAGLGRTHHLGLFRSDYILHSTDSGSLSLKQVEFNTISSSFGPLSERTAGMHRHLCASTEYFGVSPHIKAASFPKNSATTGLALGLATAHKAYNVDGSRILFVVQAGERNVFDQRWLEYELLEKHSIHVVRQTIDELMASASLDPDTRTLRVVSGVEISVVYFRAGYAPTDYPTSAHYSTRFMLERSKAINCPSIALQLAGGKKVQEFLTQPGVLERFLSNPSRWGGPAFGPEKISELRASWMGMWALNVSEDGVTPDVAAVSSGKEEHGTRKARELAESLVLKPQREGGGNNVYKSDISAFLNTLPPKERQAWIAMELITPPEGAGNYLVRAGGESQLAVKTEVVTELGIFGWALFGDPDGKILEDEAGWLVRTKGKDSNEGGVATGFSVLDSLLLVED